VTRDELGTAVVEVLRRTALAGSPREVALHEPLSELGLGLDSLALVEFFVALEEELGVELMESDWIAREELTLGSLIEHLRNATQVAVPPRRLDASGPWARFGGLSRRLLNKVYENERFLLLGRELRERPLPALPEETGARVVVGNRSHLDLVESLFQGAVARHKRRKAERWLQLGHTCLLAFAGDRIAGIDWIATSDHFDAFTGLTYRADAESCYGLDLYERPEFAGCGIGLVLLLHSLCWARERGYARQLTVVSASNLPMLTASTQLLGFETIGSIRTTRWFRRPVSSWETGEYKGRGGRMTA